MRLAHALSVLEALAHGGFVSLQVHRSLSAPQAIVTHLKAAHADSNQYLLGSFDNYQELRPLRYMCHVCLTVYASQEWLQLHMAASIHQLQRPSVMLACTRCVSLEAEQQFRHIYDEHYDEWKRHHSSMVEAAAWVDPAPQLDRYTRRTATGHASDVVVQRWEPAEAPPALPTMTSCFLPFYCACCEKVRMSSCTAGALYFN